MSRRLATVFALALTLLGLVAGPASGQVPHFNHVFIVMLENENATATFGKDSEAPYLAQRLRARGAFVPNYYAIAHLSLPNYIAMVSGQAANPQTQADCQFFNNFTPGTPTSGGQYVGSGCVYPPGVITVANQLEASGYSWKGYMEDMNANAPPGQQSPCRHPAIGSQDDTQTAEPGDQYATRHNPFVYFHSIIDFPTCAKHDVDFTHLATDLQHRWSTPNYSFIVPNLCHDGHDAPCVTGQPGGLKSVNTWLRNHVPSILRSPAFNDRGLLIVTFDEAEATGSHADASACCNEQPGPNTPNPGGPVAGPGGGRVGAVFVSPCIKANTVSKRRYNHYSLLRSIERNFQLPYLGYARQEGLRPFGRDVLNRPGCVPP
jgi:phosphatidylinositol-3-phosphatase